MEGKGTEEEIWRKTWKSAAKTKGTHILHKKRGNIVRGREERINNVNGELVGCGAEN
jgi:hypothetical protein